MEAGRVERNDGARPAPDGDEMLRTSATVTTQPTQPAPELVGGSCAAAARAPPRDGPWCAAPDCGTPAAGSSRPAALAPGSSSQLPSSPVAPSSSPHARNVLRGDAPYWGGSLPAPPATPAADASTAPATVAAAAGTAGAEAAACVDAKADAGHQEHGSTPAETSFAVGAGQAVAPGPPLALQPRKRKLPPDDAEDGAAAPDGGGLLKVAAQEQHVLPGLPEGVGGVVEGVEATAGPIAGLTPAAVPPAATAAATITPASPAPEAVAPAGTAASAAVACAAASLGGMPGAAPSPAADNPAPHQQQLPAGALACGLGRDSAGVAAEPSSPPVANDARRGRFGVAVQPAHEHSPQAAVRPTSLATCRAGTWVVGAAGAQRAAVRQQQVADDGRAQSVEGAVQEYFNSGCLETLKGLLRDLGSPREAARLRFAPPTSSSFLHMLVYQAVGPTPAPDTAASPETDERLLRALEAVEAEWAPAGGLATLLQQHEDQWEETMLHTCSRLSLIRSLEFLLRHSGPAVLLGFSQAGWLPIHTACNCYRGRRLPAAVAYLRRAKELGMFDKGFPCDMQVVVSDLSGINQYYRDAGGRAILEQALQEVWPDSTRRPAVLTGLRNHYDLKSRVSQLQERLKTLPAHC